MAEIIHDEINEVVTKLYAKLRPTADLPTLKMLCQLIQSVDKLRLFNNKDFEHLWLMENNEKQDLKVLLMQAVVNGPYAPAPLAPAFAPMAPVPPPAAPAVVPVRPTAPVPFQVLNPEDTEPDHDSDEDELSQLDYEYEEKDEMPPLSAVNVVDPDISSIMHEDE